jgi:hypothetical protein
METMFIFLRYGILIDGSHNNEKKKVPLNSPQIEHYNFQVGKAFEEILKRKTGQIILEGIRASGWYVVVMPFWYDTCNNGTVGRPEMVRGQGVNVQVGFTPDPSCFVDPKTKEFKPGGTPAEALFHELVHAFRFVTEKASKRKGPSTPPGSKKTYPEYDTEEDFFAILIANIFASETGRPLRAGHDDTATLPSHLASNQGFLAVEDYLRLVRQFCSDHPSVSIQLRDVPGVFNPIAEVLIGQSYQYLLHVPGGWPNLPDPKVLQVYRAKHPLAR